MYPSFSGIDPVGHSSADVLFDERNESCGVDYGKIRGELRGPGRRRGANMLTARMSLNPPFLRGILDADTVRSECESLANKILIYSGVSFHSQSMEVSLHA